ncbi:hypothetical protein GPJ56_004122 [Histomonas meleagridis]|uniref:uncharacterized protein n=1 Tax=Histomonas meleagridis TaxID=135588 RepID=UPI00355A9521|nr:hypothetical protein GPJ56_004122 [Histomonas meleagridis]KAH0801463.1 hypothetical protein GO595_005715 [Histomonas meleagridis]
MFEIKKQSISQLLQSTNIPEEIKESMKKAFENDDNIHQLMTQRSELSTAVYKLKSIRLLQEISTRNEYQMKLKKIEEQREQIKEEINEFNNEKVIKENAFKEQYQIVMKNVNIAKKEVEKLKRELELENQNKIKLTDWKRKHENKVSILEKKLKKLEKWSKFNPDKLMFELSTLQREIELKRKTKERAPELLEKTKNSINKELSRCKKQLKIHESLKNEYERLANVKPSQTIVDADFVQNENLEDLMEENKKLKEENEKLQQKLAELNLQIAAVSEITVGSKTKIGGLKLKASRLDGTL